MSFCQNPSQGRKPVESGPADSFQQFKMQAEEAFICFIDPVNGGGAPHAAGPSLFALYLPVPGQHIQKRIAGCLAQSCPCGDLLLGESLLGKKNPTDHVQVFLPQFCCISHETPPF